MDCQHERNMFCSETNHSALGLVTFSWASATIFSWFSNLFYWPLLAVVHPFGFVWRKGIPKPLVNHDKMFLWGSCENSQFLDTPVWVENVFQGENPHLVFRGFPSPTELDDGGSYNGLLHEDILRLRKNHRRLVVLTSSERTKVTLLVLSSMAGKSSKKIWKAKKPSMK